MGYRRLPFNLGSNWIGSHKSKWMTFWAIWQPLFYSSLIDIRWCIDVYYVYYSSFFFISFILAYIQSILIDLSAFSEWLFRSLIHDIKFYALYIYNKRREKKDQKRAEKYPIQQISNSIAVNVMMHLQYAHIFTIRKIIT